MSDVAAPVPAPVEEAKPTEVPVAEATPAPEAVPEVPVTAVSHSDCNNTSSN